MTDKHFQAILAKNDIARELRSCDDQAGLNMNLIRAYLDNIEAYIGQGNQPSIKEIIECKEFTL